MMYKTMTCYVLIKKWKSFFEAIRNSLSVKPICKKHYIDNKKTTMLKRETLMSIITFFMAATKFIPTIDDYSINNFYKKMGQVARIKNGSFAIIAGFI